MPLTTFWFSLIAVLWIGYFVLEGFDFGVGALLPFVAEDEVDRQLVLRSIGPVWDGNEVWLITAGGATFAAFPEWYASLFSGFYLPLLLVLVGIIVRGIALEYRGKMDSDRGRARCDLALTVSSIAVSVLWGVAFANIVRGVPMDAAHEVSAGFLSFLNPFALLGGLTMLLLFCLHGALFLALKTDGGVRARARTLATRVGVFAIASGGAFLLWTQLAHGRPLTDVTAVVAAVAVIAAFAANLRGREGLAFTGTAVAILLVVVTLFADLWPNVLPSTTSSANDLTVVGAASSPYTLTVMTWVAVLATPVVLLYQGWTYWVFRSRLTRGPAPVLPTPREPGELATPVGT